MRSGAWTALVLLAGCATVNLDPPCAAADTCLARGNAYAAGLRRSRDLVAAERDYRAACELGSAVACSRAATLAIREAGHSEETVAMLERACRGDAGEGCVHLADVYRDGEVVSLDLALAAVLYRRACDLGDPAGCQSLGNQYVLGQGVPVDHLRAAELYAGLCEEGILTSCGALGFLYENGLGVPKDLKRARQLYERACEGGDTTSCRKAAVIPALEDYPAD